LKTYKYIQMSDQIYLLLQNNLRVDDELYRMGQAHYCQT